jgi:hypothetical protein
MRIEDSARRGDDIIFSTDGYAASERSDLQGEINNTETKEIFHIKRVYIKSVHTVEKNVGIRS